MRLRGLTLENFRGIAQGTVLFDDTTLLVGENDSGKASVLEALSLALAPGDAAPAIESRHFRRSTATVDAPAAGDLVIALTFAEDAAGDWDGFATSPLAPLLGVAQAPRALVLEIASTLDAGGPRTRWTLRAPGRPVVDAPEALAYLRAVNPLVWVRGSDLLEGDWRDASGDAPLVGASLEERIEANHAAIVTGTAWDLRTVLRDGFDAARALLARSGDHVAGPESGFRRMVAEILDSRHGPAGEGPMPIGYTGLVAEKLGVLALTAAVLRALPDDLHPAAEPLWIVEDPETHLHPMTLAAVMALMGRIKWQKIVTTQSGDVLATEPLAGIRRLTRDEGTFRAWRVEPGALSSEDLRRVAYHLRARRAVAMFARCWLLVEGETEFWVLPELARIAGHDFAREGIVCVEYAQCGLPALIKLARALGIAWHVLADGDEAGKRYIDQARAFVGGEPRDRRLTGLAERDVEHCFFQHGYSGVFRDLAGRGDESTRRTIQRAVDRLGKPLLALELVLAASRPDAPGVPPPLRRTIETCSSLAREVPRPADPKPTPSGQPQPRTRSRRGRR